MKKSNMFLGGMGVVLLTFGFVLAGCDNGTTSGGTTVSFPVPPELLPNAKRWVTWVDSKKTTIQHNVDSDGVCKITVGGTPETNAWDIWKATAQYPYTTLTDTSYTYTFAAWTEKNSGNRKLSVQYYYDKGPPANEIYQYITITDTPKIYSIQGEPIPKGGVRYLSFRCANMIGTFYVRILSITGTGNNTLVIPNVDANFLSLFQGTWAGIAILPAGTTPDEFDMTHVVAAVLLDEDDIVITPTTANKITISAPLWTLYQNWRGDYYYDERWSESGVFDVCVFIAYDGIDIDDINDIKTVYRAGSVYFSYGNTKIDYNKFQNMPLN